jgi:arylsulfatase A-like enzyme
MRMKIFRKYLAFLIAPVVAIYAVTPASGLDSGEAHPNVLIVIEGLRPEFISRSTMPNLASASKKGMSVTNHHAVFPPLPSVNAASIITGSYPKTHGLLGDTFALANGSGEGTIDATNRDDLAEFESGGGSTLLDAPGLEEVLKATGYRSFAAGSSGISYLLDRSSTEIPPSSLSSAVERDAWAVERFLDQGAIAGVSVLWLSGIDDGLVGSESHLALLKEVDDLVGRVLKKLRKSDANVFITSSGGAQTIRKGSNSITTLLVQNGLKQNRHSDDIVVVDNTSIFVKDHDRKVIRAIVALFQHTSWIGPIYTQQIRMTHPEGIARGVLSFQSMYMDHERAPDILAEPSWSDKTNTHGVPGTIGQIGSGTALSSSPYALQIPLIAFGPNIKKRTTSDVPTANSDLAPTILHLLKIKPPETMTGRVLTEILTNGPDPEDVQVNRRRHGAEAEFKDLTYRLMMTEYSVDSVDYFGGTTVTRIKK